MKNLIFLLIGFICFAKAQNVDSANLAQLKEQLDEKNRKIEVLIQKSDNAEKRNETMFHRLKVYISKLVSSTEAKKINEETFRNNREGIKVENPTDPVTELEPDGADTIRGGWLYRLLHKNDFRLKYYKLIDNEKYYFN